MASRFGPRLDRGLGLDRIDRPQRTPRVGTYPNRQRGGGQYGSTAYPSVLEAYNRDSDYKRWRTGLDYWQGRGRGWADLERTYLVRSFRDYGALPGPQQNTVTLFPSGGASGGAWTVVNRRRGALLLNEPLLQNDITFDTSLRDPSQHRLILNVSHSLSPAQIALWGDFIGDQFEDSATDRVLPYGLLEDPIDTVAYTLVEVDPAGGKLLFDLSRPYMRRRPNRAIPRSFWQRILYDPLRPLSWRADGTRFLVSSHRLTCSCPDYSGMRTANLLDSQGGSQELFPRPSSGRTIDGRWEAEVAGYRARWRDLSFRADQRRECKHIHAVRWSLGYPFYEPSDYEIGLDDRQFFIGRDASPSNAELLLYQSRRDLTLDRLAPALADSVGRLVDTRNTIPEDEQAGVQPGRKPILWTTTQEPAASRCVVDDWWVPRGTNILKVFNAELGRFVESGIFGGVSVPMLEEVEPTALVPTESAGGDGGTAAEAAPATCAAVAYITASVPTVGVFAPAASVEAYGAVEAFPPSTGGAYTSPDYWVAGYAEGDVGVPSQTVGAVGAISSQPATGEASFHAAAVAASAAVSAPVAQGDGVAGAAALAASGAVSAAAATGDTGPATPTFVDVGAQDNGTGALSVSWPAHQTNDIALLLIERSGSDTAPAISGWSELSGSPVIDVTNSNGSSLQVLWRRAVSGAEAAVSVPDGGNHQVARIWVFRGCIASGTPFEASTTGTKPAASTTATIPAVTTTSAVTLVVGIASTPRDFPQDQFTSPVNANLEELTLRGQAQTNAGDGGGYALVTGVKRGPGSSGTTTLSMNNSDTNAYVALALAPVPV